MSHILLSNRVYVTFLCSILKVHKTEVAKGRKKRWMMKKALVRILLSSKTPSCIKTTRPTNEVFLSTHWEVFVLGHVLVMLQLLLWCVSVAELIRHGFLFWSEMRMEDEPRNGTGVYWWGTLVIYFSICCTASLSNAIGHSVGGRSVCGREHS